MYGHQVLHVPPDGGGVGLCEFKKLRWTKPQNQTVWVNPSFDEHKWVSGESVMPKDAALTKLTDTCYPPVGKPASLKDRESRIFRRFREQYLDFHFMTMSPYTPFNTAKEHYSRVAFRWTVPLLHTRFSLQAAECKTKSVTFQPVLSRTVALISALKSQPCLLKLLAHTHSPGVDSNPNPNPIYSSCETSSAISHRLTHR